MSEFRQHFDPQTHEETKELQNTIIIKKDTPIQSNRKRRERRKRGIPGKTLWCVLGGILLLFSLVALFSIKHLYGFMHIRSYGENEHVIMQEERFDVDENDTSAKFEKINPEEVKWNNSGEIKKVEGITNILLLADGEQEGSLERGRSDVIMIATINTKKKTLKLTSIMRDTYVQIPGYLDNRINTAYRTGDVPLLEKTIEQNFNISVDGYIKVNFDGFANIIDELGGVEIAISEAEAKWLNKGNHIFDPESRTVKPGVHTLNGSQALGYCIIRRVNTTDGLAYDFGRVWRQRLVLTTLFDKYKDESITKIVSLAPKILSNITTDLPESKLLSLFMTALDLDVKEIQTITIPVDGSYEGKMIRGMSVLVPDLSKNIAVLDTFLYGVKKQETQEQIFSVSDYEMNFNVSDSDTKFKATNKETKLALDVLKGYKKLTIRDINRERFKVEH